MKTAHPKNKEAGEDDGKWTKYSAEWKTDVLKLAEEIGVSAACEQLELSTKTVYNWRREERRGARAHFPLD